MQEPPQNNRRAHAGGRIHRQDRRVDTSAKTRVAAGPRSKAAAGFLRSKLLQVYITRRHDAASKRRVLSLVPRDYGREAACAVAQSIRLRVTRVLRMPSGSWRRARSRGGAVSGVGVADGVGPAEARTWPHAAATRALLTQPQREREQVENQGCARNAAALRRDLQTGRRRREAAPGGGAGRAAPGRSHFQVSAQTERPRAQLAKVRPRRPRARRRPVAPRRARDRWRGTRRPRARARGQARGGRGLRQYHDSHYSAQNADWPRRVDDDVR